MIMRLRKMIFSAGSAVAAGSHVFTPVNIPVYRKAEGRLAPQPEVQDTQPIRAEKIPHGENPRVLMVGPGPQVRGGITSVITAYMESPLCEKYSFSWLSTYDDRGPIR